MAIATSNFMNEVYNGGFAPESSVSMLKETIALVRDYANIENNGQWNLMVLILQIAWTWLILCYAWLLTIIIGPL